MPTYDVEEHPERWARYREFVRNQLLELTRDYGPLDQLWLEYRLTWVSLTLDLGYLLTAAPPDLERGIALLGPPAPAQPPLLGHVVAPPGCRPCTRALGSSSGRRPGPRMRGSYSADLEPCLEAGREYCQWSHFPH